MSNNEYTIALEKAISELDARVLKRDILNAEITGLKETVRVLSSRVQLSAEKERQIVQLLAMVDYATPNLKDSIRSVLIRSGWAMTAVEIRNALEESGFNFEDFSNPLSACHATLKRMAIDGEVEPGTKDGKTSYRVDLKIARPPSADRPRGLMEILAGAGVERPTEPSRGSGTRPSSGMPPRTRSFRGITQPPKTGDKK